MSDATKLPQTFAFHPRLAHEFGSTAGILASYFMARGAYSYELDVTFAQIERDTGLTAKQIVTARDKLVNANALRIRTKRIEHRTFYALNMVAICHLIDSPQ